MDIGNSSKPRQHIVPTKYLEGFGTHRKERARIYFFDVKRKKVMNPSLTNWYTHWISIR